MCILSPCPTSIAINIWCLRSPYLACRHAIDVANEAKVIVRPLGKGACEGGRVLVVAAVNCGGSPSRKRLPTVTQVRRAYKVRCGHYCHYQEPRRLYTGLLGGEAAMRQRAWWQRVLTNQSTETLGLFTPPQQCTGDYLYAHGWQSAGFDALGEADLEPRAWMQLTPHSRHQIWVGSGGGGSQMHFDYSHNFIVQLLGRKRVWLAPPGAWPQECMR